MNTSNKPDVTVIMSFYYAITPAHGNCFQTWNQPEHESDDCTGNTHVCVTSEKDMALQQQIWSTFVTVLWFIKTKITDGNRILVFVGYNFQIYWKCWQHSSKIHLKVVAIFVPLKYVERNGTFGLFDINVNGNVMLAHVMTFPWTSVSQNFVGEEEWSIQFSCNLIIFLNFSCF